MAPPTEEFFDCFKDFMEKIPLIFNEIKGDEAKKELSLIYQQSETEYKEGLLLNTSVPISIMNSIYYNNKLQIIYGYNDLSITSVDIYVISFCGILLISFNNTLNDKGDSDQRLNSGVNGENLTFSNDYEADSDINKEDAFFNQDISNYGEKDNSDLIIRDKRYSYFSSLSQ